MTRTTRFRHLHFAVVTMLLALSLLVAANPAVQVFAEIQATPVVESPVPAVATAEADDAEAVESIDDSFVAGESDAVDSSAETSPVMDAVEDEIDSESELVSTPDAPATKSATTSPSAAPMASGPAVTLVGCAVPQNALLPGGSITFNCTLTKVGGTPFAGVSYSDPDRNFMVAVVANPAGASATKGRTHTFQLPDGNGVRSVQLTITISAVATTPPNAIFDSTFEACDPAGGSVNSNCFGTGSTFRVTRPLGQQTVTLVEGTDYKFECNDMVREPGDAWATANTNCTVTALRDGTLRLDNISWSSTASSGWDTTIDGRSVSMSGEPISPSDVMVSKLNPYRFSVSMTPVGCEANQSPRLTIGVQVSFAGQTAVTSTSDGVPLAATFDAPKTDATAKLIAIPGAVAIDYSMTKQQDLSAGFTAEYTASGCKPWTGYAEMSEFTPASDAEVISVPVLESMTPGAPVIISGGTKVVKPAEPNSNNAAPTTLITGDAPGKKVVVEQNINLKYTVPANTTIGTYESTVTVNTTSAP